MSEPEYMHSAEAAILGVVLPELQKRLNASSLSGRLIGTGSDFVVVEIVATVQCARPVLPNLESA